LIKPLISTTMKTFSHFFKATLLVCCLMAACLGTATANNVQITNLTVVNTTTLQFDLSWENSWRTNHGPGFDTYDAAYIFFRYRKTGTFSAFEVAPLAATNPISGLPSGFIAPAVPGCIGVFVHRGAAPYTGSPSMTGLQANLALPLPYDVDVRAFAIEMVYVAGNPTPVNGYFWVGDRLGSTFSAHSIRHGTDPAPVKLFTPPSQIPVEIIVNDPLPSDDVTSLLIGPDNKIIGYPDYPIGASSFWAMKYEISQGGYRDFLNSLSLSQQDSITSTSAAVGTGVFGLPSGVNRHYLEIKTQGNTATEEPATFGCDADGDNVWDEANDGEWVACVGMYILGPSPFSRGTYHAINYYLDWAGLAMMSELQYEKLARGLNQPPATLEYAWGNTSIYPGTAPYILSNAGTSNETITNASATEGNANYTTTSNTSPGPMRCGIFGTSNSTRVTSGASFYGAMDLSGNVYETCASAFNACGLTLNSLNGDGDLSTPFGLDSSCTLLSSGQPEIFYRGGSWKSNGSSKLQISDRSASGGPGLPDRNEVGGRGVFHLP
jgi:formylglycine-generating enzyme required for sulfatase activity